MNYYEHAGPQRILFLWALPEKSTREQASDNENDYRSITVKIDGEQ